MGQCVLHLLGQFHKDEKAASGCVGDDSGPMVSPGYVTCLLSNVL